MERDEALRVIDAVVSKFRGTPQQCFNVIEALSVIKVLLTPPEEPTVEDKPDVAS